MNISQLTQEIQRLSDVITEYNKLGSLYCDRGNVEQGIQEFIQAQYIGKHYAEAFYRRGKSYFENHYYDKAIEDFSETLKYNNTTIYALYARGLSYYNKNEPDNAVKDWQSILNEYPEHSLSFKNINAVKNRLTIEDNFIPIRTIVLLMCGKNKLSQKAKAKDIYTSPRFQNSIKYAKTLTDYFNIFVLSANNHLLSLDEEIYPYDKSLYDMSEKEILLWAENVNHLFNTVSNPNEDKYIFLTNDYYSKYLLTYISNYVLPLSGIPEDKHIDYFYEKLSSKEISK